MADANIHYLAIGHIARDLTPDGPKLGGTVSFSALTAQAMGYTPGIVTACGPEAPLSALGGMALHQKPSAVSTTFENLYNNGARTQYLRGQAAPLSIGDVPIEWLRAPIVHIAPLASELGPELLADFEGAFIGLTPQGWFREWDETGRVRARRWPSDVDWPASAPLFARAGAIVFSIEDVGGDWSLVERWARVAQVLAVTRGREGCTIFKQGAGARDFDAVPQTEVDPTGAGDIFAAAFFVHCYETQDPYAAAVVANHIAGVSVTRPGIAGVPNAEEVGLARMKSS